MNHYNNIFHACMISPEEGKKFIDSLSIPELTLPDEHDHFCS